MSDQDPASRPIDKLYAQSEALLDDGEARAARRARVLAAVARDPAATGAPSSTSQHRGAWGRGGWLAAACVAGLGVLFTTHAYHPAADRLEMPTRALPERGATPAPLAGRDALTMGRAPKSSAAVPTAAKPPPPDFYRSASPVTIAPAPNAFPAPPPSAAPELQPPPIQPHIAPPAPINIAPPQSVFIAPVPPAPPAPAPAITTRLSAGVQTDQAERLRAAAAGGRTAGIRALLAQGVSIDAVDREGDTALMKSIEADDVVAAAVLLQNGASLRLRNHAGVSAEDMALAKDDPALRRALGLDP